MAGPQDIQRYPRGLIDLLGMRATGETPHKLAQDMSGVLELLELYLNDRLTPNASASAGNIIATGDVPITGLTVPEREMWLIWEMTLTTGLFAAATAANVTGGLLRNRGSGNVFTALTPTQKVVAAEQACVGSKFDRPVIALPGNVAACRVSAITGLPLANAVISILYAPLAI